MSGLPKFVRFSGAFVWHLAKNKRAALPLPFRNGATMKVVLLGRALVLRASQGGFIYMRVRVMEPVGERPISHTGKKKMPGNFN